MRSLLLLCVLAVSVGLALAAPQLNVCDADAVQLELRPSHSNNYQLAFVAIDPKAGQNKADFIDIHYRSESYAHSTRAASIRQQQEPPLGRSILSPRSCFCLPLLLSLALSSALQREQRGQCEFARAD